MIFIKTKYAFITYVRVLEIFIFLQFNIIDILFYNSYIANLRYKSYSNQGHVSTYYFGLISELVQITDVIG